MHRQRYMHKWYVVMLTCGHLQQNLLMYSRRGGEMYCKRVHALQMAKSCKHRNDTKTHETNAGKNVTREKCWKHRNEAGAKTYEHTKQMQKENSPNTKKTYKTPETIAREKCC